MRWTGSQGSAQTNCRKVSCAKSWFWRD